jgi:hypothetical protein
VARIAKAAQDGDWRAAAWWLERRRHGEWRLRQETQLTGMDGEPLGATLSNEDRIERIAYVLDRSRARAAGRAQPADPEPGAAGGPVLTDGALGRSRPELG